MPAKPTAIYTRIGVRLPVDGDIEVILREAARFPIGRGWAYRFKSGGKWILAPLDAVAFYEFGDRPEGAKPGEVPAPSSRSVRHAAQYVDEL